MSFRAFDGRGLWVSRLDGSGTKDITRAALWTRLKDAKRAVQGMPAGLYTIYNLRTIKSVERVDTRSRQ